MRFGIKFEEKKRRSVHSLYLFGLPGMLLLKKLVRILFTGMSNSIVTKKVKLYSLSTAETKVSEAVWENLPSNQRRHFESPKYGNVSLL